MQTGNRFRCYPSPAQEQVLLRWMGCQRFIYNAKVGEDRYFRAFARKTLAMTGVQPPVDQAYAQFIGEETPWLREVPSPVLRNGAVRWAQAYQRFFKGLAGRPKIRKKHGPQSLWLTSELFAFDPIVSTQTGETLGCRLLIGTKKFPVGPIAFTAHKDYRLPASIRLILDAGHWYLTFSTEDGVPEPDEEYTVAWLRQFSEDELLERTFGGDRGVEIPLAGNDGQRFDCSPAQRVRIVKKEARVRRCNGGCRDGKKAPSTGRRPSARWPPPSATPGMSAKNSRTRPVTAWWPTSATCSMSSRTSRSGT